MRKIKFRALFKKEWVYVTLKDLCDCIGINEYAAEGTAEDLFSIGKYKTQFTGLKDKNGKEIYEGDIVENVVEGNGVIYFSNITGGFLVKRNKISTCINAKEVFNDKFSDMIMISRDEVIGNIYENPELLEASK